MEHYNLAVIGSGPAGQKAAIQAAKVDKRVAIIDRQTCLGGACIHRSAIPSKTLREAVLYFTGFYHRQTYGVQRRRDLTMQDLLDRCAQVVDYEAGVIAAQLERNRVEIIEGEASFADPHTLRVGSDRSLAADYIVIATGSVPARPATVPFEEGVIVDADGVITFGQLPRTLVVVGAGLIGAEYASILALLDIEVTLIDRRPRLLDFVDLEIAEALSYHMRDIGVTLHFGEACHAFGLPTYHRPELLPYGIYTVPEISMVGKNEEQLTEERVPYQIGVARYREIARGQILGDRVGMLKLLFHQDSRRLLGVHALGQGATELIHIGQAVLAFDGTIDFFIQNAFNYPTLAECYRVAALDGYNKVAAQD